eukprot:jgi/Astpho2/7453/e_gw1.00114.209.1_t
MTIWTLLQACLLMVNGVAVLNNERFLEPYGLGYSRLGGSNTMDDGAKGLRAQIIGALHAVAYLRGVLFLSLCRQARGSGHT